ncbi:MAG: Cys-tRNA(Pro) deacylase [Victivallales bacterium]|jgi:Cys-tRNA(Pro)/Cys-tRNA(Cys) deacylase|nr:Cys-tRNA(Pro) deacylase [Victivallales bacterium]
MQIGDASTSPKVKTNVLRLLEGAQIPFRWYEYEIMDGRLDAKSLATTIGEPEEQVFKTLVTCGATPRTHFVFVIPATMELDLKKAAKACGQKFVEMLPQRELLPLTGYVHGGCSPIGQKKLFPTWIDETAILFDYICVSGGRIGLNIAIAPETLRNFIGAQFVDLGKDSA